MLTNLVLACGLYGTDDFQGPIQTIRLYEKYAMLITKGEYLCIFAIRNIIALSAVVIFLYLFFVLFRSKSLATLCMLSFLWIEWYLELKIPVNSNLRVLKYVNLYTFFRGALLEQEYLNLHLFGKAISAVNVLLLVELLVISVGGSLSAFIYAKQYPKKRSLFSSVVRFGEIRMQYILEKLPWLLQEFYKILICKKAVLFLILGLWICNWVTQKTEINFPELQNDMDEIYKEYGGSEWNTFDSYINGLEEKQEQNLIEAEQINLRIKAGDVEAERISEVLALQSQSAGISNMLREFYEKQQLREEVKTNTGIDVYMISDRGYNEILGKNSFLRESIVMIVLITIVAICSSGFWEIEKQSNIMPLVKSSTCGVVWMWRRKIYIIFFLITIIFGGVYGSVLCSLIQQYNMPYIDAPIQSLTFFADSTIRLSILQVMVFIILSKYFTLICVSMIISYIAINRGVKNQLYISITIILFSIVCMLVAASGRLELLLIMTLVEVGSVPLGIRGTYKRWCTDWR